jgi:seryl-tRNA synthetase
MTREELKNIVEGITDEQLKSILDIHSADIGKIKKENETLKEENTTLKDGKKDLEDKIKKLTDDANDNAGYKKQLEDLRKEIKDKEDADKKAKEDAELTSAITAVFGDKVFTSDYVKNGIIADMKTEIAKPENKGKGYAEIFEVLTKDKEGIFANPNPPAPIPGMGQVNTGSITKEQFAKMGYLERNKLFNENRDLYNQLKE